jgi:hypothetical protein
MAFWSMCCFFSFFFFDVTLTKAEEYLKVSSDSSLRAALASHTPHILLSDNLILETPLVITNSHIKIIGTGLSSSYYLIIHKTKKSSSKKRACLNM